MLNKQQYTKMDRKQLKWKLNVPTKVTPNQSRF